MSAWLQILCWYVFSPHDWLYPWLADTDDTVGNIVDAVFIYVQLLFIESCRCIHQISELFAKFDAVRSEHVYNKANISPNVLNLLSYPFTKYCKCQFSLT